MNKKELLEKSSRISASIKFRSPVRDLSMLADMAFSTRKTLIAPKNDTQLRKAQKIYKLLTDALVSIRAQNRMESTLTLPEFPVIQVKYAQFLSYMDEGEDAQSVISSLINRLQNVTLPEPVSMKLKRTIKATAEGMRLLSATSEQAEEEKDCPPQLPENASEEERFNLLFLHAARLREQGKAEKALLLFDELEVLCPLTYGALSDLKREKSFLFDQLGIPFPEQKEIEQEAHRKSNELISDFKNHPDNRHDVLEKIVRLGKHSYIHHPSPNGRMFATASLFYLKYMKDSKSAFDLAKLSIKIRFNAPLNRSAYALAIAREKGEIDEGIDILKNANTRYPSYGIILDALVKLHSQKGDIAAAYDYALQLADLSHSSSRLTGIKYCLRLNQRAGRSGECLSSIVTEAQKHSDKSFISAALGHYYLERKDMDNALKYFEKAYEQGYRDPYSITVCYRMCLNHYGLHRDADEVLREMTEKFPNNPYVLLSNLRFDAIVRQDMDDAKKKAERLKALHPLFFEKCNPEEIIKNAALMSEQQRAENILDRYEDEAQDENTYDSFDLN